MDDERQSQPDDEVQVPEERVEDLAPDEDEADDVSGGKHIGNVKYNDFTVN